MRQKQGVPIIYDRSRKGARAYSLPDTGVPGADISSVPEKLVRKTPPALPEVFEVDIVRHYSRLASLNYSLDRGIYPLGSCTMKYNPRLNEQLSSLPGFTRLHPLTPAELSQGAMKILYQMQEYLKEITGMSGVTLAPAAGAHGELTGLLMIKAYYENKGERRNTVLIPDTAHGTNPASVRLAGFTPVTIKTGPEGFINADSLKPHLSPDVACLMVTNPNTLGIYERDIRRIIQLLHENGSLSYCDGANLNALLGRVKPGDTGFDVIQINIHKTFAAPHGGGGPGSGPVAVSQTLVDFLPEPVVSKSEDGFYRFASPPRSIGRIKLFYGQFQVLLKGYIYIRMLGPEGLRQVSGRAVLNAAYLRKKLENVLDSSYSTPTLHEFVVSAARLKKEKGIRTLDLAKALLDAGVHAPTMYFPLIVEEALMIEPTETEPRESLDSFADILADAAAKTQDELGRLPVNTPVRRVNEAQTARRPVLRWKPES